MKEKEKVILYRCRGWCQRGGEARSLQRGRLGDPGGLITRRAVSTFAFSMWPQVQINPPLLIFQEEAKNHLAINFEPELKPDDLFSIPYLWTGLVKCL
jgi:hypothetical protein